MKQKQNKSETRTTEQISKHYAIETELANKLRNASKQERKILYSYIYDELYRLVPDHPQLNRKQSSSETAQDVQSQLSFLRIFITDDSKFLEVGPGDCSLSYEVAKYVKQVFAVDISEEITRSSENPSNFQLILTKGCDIPLPHNSIDVAYSNHLIEHLHPDDALEQLQNIYNILAPGGRYICITPNKLKGPHDISKYFDEIATGLHLKEYTIFELKTLFRHAGFANIIFFGGARGIFKSFPVSLMVLYESLLDKLPNQFKKTIVQNKLFGTLLDIRIVGIK